MLTPEQEIEYHLDGAAAVYFRGGLSADARMSVDGEMRGLSIALAVLRGTSALGETLAAERRVKDAQ